MELPSFPDEYALMDAYILVFSVDSRARLALIVSRARINSQLNSFKGTGPIFQKLLDLSGKPKYVCCIWYEQTLTAQAAGHSCGK